MVRAPTVITHTHPSTHPPIQSSNCLYIIISAQASTQARAHAHARTHTTTTTVRTSNECAHAHNTAHTHTCTQKGIPVGTTCGANTQSDLVVKLIFFIYFMFNVVMQPTRGWSPTTSKRKCLSVAPKKKKMFSLSFIIIFIIIY